MHRFTTLTRRSLPLLLLLVLLLGGCQSENTQTVTALPTPARTAAPRQAAQSDGTTQTSEEKTVLTLGAVVAEGASASPFQTNEADVVSLNKLAYESVVELGDDRMPTPLLADRWEKDGATWTFYLRAGITFHNGVALTAEDVVKSYEQIMMAGDTNPYFDRVQNIRELTCVDNATLRAVAKNDGYMFLYAMTFPVAQRATLEDAFPMGTGAFWYVTPADGVAYQLEQNPFWWKRAALIDVVQLKRYDDASELLTAFELGEIDALNTRAGTASLSRKLTDRATLDYSTNVYECLVPNTASGLLSDVKVRQAIMYAIDRSTLSSTIYQDMAQMSEVPVLPGTYLNESQSTTYYYSPERALQILYELGWADTDGDGTLDRIQDGLLQDFTISLITYNEPTRDTRFDAATLIAEQLSKIGIRVTVTKDTKEKVRTALKTDAFELALVAYNLSDTPDLSFLLKGTAASNYANYSDLEMDALLDEVLNAATQEDLKLAMSHLQLKIVNDLPIMGLFFRSGVIVSSRGLNGLTGVRADQIYRGIEFWELTD